MWGDPQETATLGLHPLYRSHGEPQARRRRASAPLLAAVGLLLLLLLLAAPPRPSPMTLPLDFPRLTPPTSPPPSKAVAKLKEDLQLQKDLEGALERLRSDNAQTRNDAFLDYFRLSLRSGWRQVKALARPLQGRFTGGLRAVQAAGGAAGAALERQWPAGARVVKRAGRGARRLGPPAQAALTAGLSAGQRVLTPALRPAATVARGVAGAGQRAAAAAVRVVEAHPRTAAVSSVTVAVAASKVGRRLARTPRVARAGAAASCPEGTAEVLVVGMPRPQCAEVPACNHTTPLGNCPPATPTQSFSCQPIEGGGYGCVLEGLEAPLDADVQS